MGAPVRLAEVTAYLDGYLRVREIPDSEQALNGLQVESGSGGISRIVAAVDASLATIEGTAGGSLLLVHHGLFWDGNIPLTGRRFRRVRALLDRDIALYSAHIPLDLHAEVGNNHVLARLLGLTDLQPFDNYHGAMIGVEGRLVQGIAREALSARLEQLLDTKVKLIPGGPPTSQRIGIITGGAGDRIRVAAEAGLDSYITGEGAHHTYFDAMELGVNAFYAGHYATETVGVKALAEHLSLRFNIPWEFHDHPTGL